MTWTSTHVPSTWRPAFTYAWASWVSSADFSLDAATVSGTQPARLVGLSASGVPDEGLRKR